MCPLAASLVPENDQLFKRPSERTCAAGTTFGHVCYMETILVGGSLVVWGWWEYQFVMAATDQLSAVGYVGHN